MGERLVRALRGVTRSSAPSDDRDDLTAADGGDDRPSRRCGASGWWLRVACTDGHGGAVCPVCGRHVRAHADPVVRRPMLVISEHAS